MTDRNAKPPLAEYPPLLKSSEVAEALRIEPERVRTLTQTGQLPASRVGGPRSEWLYDKRRIVALIEQRDPWEELPSLLEDMPDVLTAAEVAQLLRMTRPFIARLAADGVLPGAFKTGSAVSSWRFDRRRIAERLVPTNRPTPPEPPPSGPATP
ncbi:helix-turn-helix domain-containing protein [Streptomyces canus]|uniref:helix-turn-helix domain-containing protein n=1 Tax=Streptomyces canus TaxID=58343 RepID=UPI002E266C6B